MNVVKAGGSVLRSSDDYLKLAEVALRLGARVVVVSAMKGVTDALLEAARLRDVKRFGEVAARLREAASDLGARGEAEEWIRRGERAFRSYAASPAPQLLDEVLALGERVSMVLMRRALEALGTRAVALDGGEAGIVTDDAFTGARPIISECVDRLRARIRPLLEKGYIVVVAGFTGATRDGRTTTMGRGSSDLTAALVARALEAERLYLVTNSPYIMSADPSLVPTARPLSEVGILEADAMARLGVKKFHPLTFKPLLDAKCMIVVGSSPPRGTLVKPELPPPDLKVVTPIRGYLAFVGHGSQKLAPVIAEELSLPLAEVGRLYFKLKLPRREAELVVKAHEVMLKYW